MDYLDPYPSAIRQVEERIAQGQSFDEIEDFINDELQLPGLDDEQRSALWFYALSTDNTPATRPIKRKVAFGPIADLA